MPVCGAAGAERLDQVLAGRECPHGTGVGVDGGGDREPDPDEHLSFAANGFGKF